ncbi:UHRF1-binding protein 1-like [Papilio machaon]|uniref:UHRF1-binding protein 1-like n=1 Tax=Papilio machaon TaxID=76193 RepID=A0A0N1IN97_PAPMA|nr:UHRF1-binding protein 1-like [Papilio machaon]
MSIFDVSTGSKSRETPRPLVSAEKATLPGDAGLLHAELTFFYYPGDVCFPVPSPKLYVQLSPVRVSVDVPSVVWLSAFLPHVGRALATATAAEDQTSYIDVRTEAIMPKLVLEAGPEHVSQQRDRPKELHICTARATFTNVRESPRSNTAGTRADLASIISCLRRAAPHGGQFPCMPDDLDPIHEQFLLHADNLDDIDRGSAISPELLWRENRSVWCARVEPLWADFCGARATNYKPAPLLDATPLTAWLYFDEGFSRIWVIGRTCGLAGLQLNHYQLLFLLRTLERVAEMMAWLAHDAARQPDGDDGSIVVGIVVPAVELTLVLPSNCPGQESSRDLDSVPLDSSSLQDLKMGSEATMAPSMQDRDSAVLSLPAPIEVCSVQPLPAEEVPPSPGISFGGFSSMRRGLTSLVTSLDALGRDDSRSDAASTASSDSERYVLVGLAAESPDDADVAFREFEQGRMSTGVEVAAEVVERSSSPSDHSLASSCRRRDLISTCTWRLNNIHLVQQSSGGKSSLRLAADDLSTDECAAIPWDEFQVLIENVKLHLIEDRPTRSISSPPPQPLDLDLSSLRVTRDNTGVVYLGPPLATPSTVTSPATPTSQHDEAAERIEQLSKENEELRKRLVTLARIAEDNRELRAKVEEASVLKQCVHAAQQEAANLLADKQQLLDAVRVLQVSSSSANYSSPLKGSEPNPTRAWTEPVVDETELKTRDTPHVALRLIRNELPKQVDEKGESTGLAAYEELLEARVRDLSIALNMSTALALAEFIEDEIIAPPMPLEVTSDVSPLATDTPAKA